MEGKGLSIGNSGKGQKPKQCSSTRTSPHPFKGNYEEELDGTSDYIQIKDDTWRKQENTLIIKYANLTFCTVLRQPAKFLP